MNIRYAKSFSTFLIVSVIWLFNANIANAQQELQQAKNISLFLPNDQDETPEWYLLKAILNNDAKEIKLAIQKNTIPKENNKKTVVLKLTTRKNSTSKKTLSDAQQTKQNRNSFFKVVHVNVVIVVKALFTTSSKITHSICGYFRS